VLAGRVGVYQTASSSLNSSVLTSVGAASYCLESGSTNLTHILFFATSIDPESSLLGVKPIP
jgi:hypothetical protein